MSQKEEAAVNEEQLHEDEQTTEPTVTAEAEETPVESVIEVDPLADLTRLAEDNHQRFLRAQADFDNFRRRSRQEKEEFAKYASLKLLGAIVPIYDNFERALQASQENNNYESLAKGVEMIFRQFQQALEQEGLVVMEPVGQPFNPEYHQAIMQVESEEHEEGIVVEQVQRGYMLKDKVLRPAMVKVSG